MTFDNDGAKASQSPPKQRKADSAATANKALNTNPTIWERRLPWAGSAMTANKALKKNLTICGPKLPKTGPFRPLIRCLRTQAFGCPSCHFLPSSRIIHPFHCFVHNHFICQHNIGMPCKCRYSNVFLLSFL